MNVSPAGVGNVKVNNAPAPSYPAVFAFPKYSQVTLEAVPAYPYYFTGWSQDLTGYGNPSQIDMTCDKWVTANFLPELEPSPNASLGNFVWKDVDGNGIQDEGEPGLDGISVNLYRSDNSLVGSVLTVNGAYSFSDLAPGDYYLHFSSFEGYIFSPQNKSPDDNLDSDVDRTGATGVITLDSGVNDPGWDAGLYQFDAFISYSISLLPGWNLISLPLVPRYPQVEDIFAGVAVQGVAGYDDSTGTWQFYAPGAPSGLIEMHRGKGYWVKVSAQCTLTLQGKVPPLPDYVQLEPGWNLIGMPFIAEPQSIPDVFGGVSMSGLTTYDADTKTWHLYRPDASSNLRHVDNGKGYWVNTSSPSVVIFQQLAQNVTAQEANALMPENQSNPNFLIIDLRTPAEYESGYIPGALNIDYYSPILFEELNSLDKSKTYLIYCKSGYRSALTLNIMKDIDFRKIYHMPGGITEWKAGGLPVITP